MALQGIRGATRAKKRFTTKADPAAVRAPDLVNRDFTANRPDALWVADFTYCSTWSGIVYVAFIIDVYSRRLVGWKAARSMTATLVVDALNMAAWSRRHTTFDGLVCHTDAGSQGEINWSSQHLDERGGRCATGTDKRKSASIGDIFPHREGLPWRGDRTGSSSGRRSLAA
jgi:putative transposase